MATVNQLMDCEFASSGSINNSATQGSIVRCDLNRCCNSCEFILSESKLVINDHICWDCNHPKQRLRLKQELVWWSNQVVDNLSRSVKMMKLVGIPEYHIAKIVQNVYKQLNRVHKLRKIAGTSENYQTLIYSMIKEYLKKLFPYAFLSIPLEAIELTFRETMYINIYQLDDNHNKTLITSNPLANYLSNVYLTLATGPAADNITRRCEIGFSPSLNLRFEINLVNLYLTRHKQMIKNLGRFYPCLLSTNKIVGSIVQ